MAWSQIVADGRGAAAYMLDVEGWPDLWVTTAALAGTQSDTRVRREGLVRKGLGKKERLRIAEGKLDVGGFRARIVDKDLAATVSFTKEPTQITWLTATVPDDVTTSWEVAASAVFTTNGHYHCGTEVVQVTAKPDATHATVVRGQWGTLARAHVLGFADRLQFPVITNRPTILFGRRCKLYAFGPDELALGAAAVGTVIFRGRLNSNHVLEPSGAAYSFGVDHIGASLNQDIAAGLDKGVHIRGIYYAFNAPLVVRVQESGIASGVTVTVSGFYESQSAFLAQVNSQLSAAIVAAGFTQRVVAVGDERDWWFEIQTTGSPVAVHVHAQSMVDGHTDEFAAVATAGDPTIPYTSLDSLAANTVYVVEWFIPDSFGEAYADPEHIIPRTVPRAAYDDGTGRPGDSSTAPDTRLFLDRADLVNVNDDLGSFVVTAKNSGGTVGSADVDRPLRNGRTGLAITGRDFAFTVSNRFTIGTVADFVTSLEAAVPTSTPGVLPNISIADLSVSASVVNSAVGGGGALLTRRLYRFSRGQKLSDVLAKECLLGGLIPYVTTAGKISVRKLALLASTDTLASTIAARIVSNTFGAVDGGAEGYFGAVEVKSGYDPESDKFIDDELIRNVKAIELYQATRTIVIDPKITVLGMDRASREDCNSVAWPLLTLFSERYAVLTVPVTLKDYGTTIGDVVSLTIPQLPFAGARGITNKVALVLGDEWDYDSGKGVLTLFLSSLNLAGYAPTARVSSQVDNTGNNWTLTIDRSFYFADPTRPVSDHFAVDDTVRVIQWNSATPTSVTGTVTFVTDTTIRVQFSGAWVPGGSTWNLMFRDRGSTVVRQRVYAFIAGSDRRFATTEPARVYGA